MKTIVNESLRAGLDRLEGEHRMVTHTYKISSVKLGPKLPDLNNIADILALDDEAGS